jgi:hypothetical protein
MMRASRFALPQRVLTLKRRAVRLQSTKRALHRFADVLRPAVHARDATVLVDLEAKLRCDDDPVAPPHERAGQQLFVRAWTVHLGRVEEGHPELDGPMNGRDGLALVALLRSSVGLAHPHAAEPDGRDVEGAGA